MNSGILDCRLGLLLSLILLAPVTIGTCQDQTPLIQAAHSGDARQVKQLLAQGVDINGRDGSGRTALMVGASEGHKPVVEVLLTEGAEVNLQTPLGSTAMRFAATADSVDILKALIQSGASVNIKDKSGWTPIIHAAIKGKAANVKILQSAGASLPADLVYPAALGDIDMVQQMLKQGADVNATNEIGWMPLAAAAVNGHVEIVNLLLHKGAQTDSTGMDRGWRMSALTLAADRGHLEVVKTLLGKKADANLTSFDVAANKSTGRTALMEAVYSGHAEVVRAVVEGGANPNDRFPGARKRPLLSGAVQSPAVLKVLLDKGANVNATDEDGATALIAASYFGCADSVALLLQRGARVSAKNQQGYTALQIATMLRDQEKVEAKVPEREKVVELLSVGGFKATRSATVLDSRAMTKADWKKAYYNRFPVGSIVTVAKFKSVFGEPSRTQTVQNDAFWYYACSDGVIQVVLNNPSVLGSGACIQSVNDY